VCECEEVKANGKRKKKISQNKQASKSKQVEVLENSEKCEVFQLHQQQQMKCTRHWIHHGTYQMSCASDGAAVDQLQHAID